MMEGFENIKLENLCFIKGGKRLPKGETLIDTKTNHPYIRARDIRNGKINFTNPKYLSKNVYEKIKRYIVREADVVLTIVGANIGDVGYITTEFDGANLTENAVKLSAKPEKLNPLYLKYVLLLDAMKEYFQVVASGAAQGKLGLYKIKTMEIPVPLLTHQRKIANILSAYDDLIENNLKRIKLLEEMAQNEFNNWYANNEDFNEVNLGSIIGHEIGGGWGAEEQSEEFNKPAYVIRGTDIDELPNGKLEKVPFRYHKKSNLASRNLQDGDIIFEVSGGSSYEGVAKTLLVTDELLKQFDNAVMPASFCKLARPIERKYSSFLFLFWRFLRNIRGTEVFEIRSASNIVNYNWTAFLKFQKINKPSETELEKLNRMVEPIYKQVYNLGNQNQRLKEARDILLPRLMTGMIDVDKMSASGFAGLGDEQD